MKTNILKQIRNFSMVTATILLVGCGGGGGDSAPSNTPVNTTVSGNAVDGPIYGADVNVYSLTGTTILATTTTSDGTDGKGIGEFSLAVPDLPAEYIIRVSGGTDAGPDGKMNDNDELSTFDMSSVGTKAEANTTYVSPATSLIVENIKETNQTIAEAKESVSASLGLPIGTDLTTSNPKTDVVASKAGAFVAQIVKAIPSTNKVEVLKSIAAVFKTGADSNKSVVTISASDVVLKDDLNLSAIADDMPSSAISTDDKSKLTKAEAVLESRIELTAKSAEPVIGITADEIKVAKAEKAAFDKIVDEVKDATDANSISAEQLTRIAIKVQEGVESILNSDKNITAKNIDIITQVIENNLDKNISEINSTLNSITDIDSSVIDTISEKMNGTSSADILFVDNIIKEIEENNGDVNSSVVTATETEADDLAGSGSPLEVIDALKEDGNITAAEILSDTISYNLDLEISVTTAKVEILRNDLLAQTNLSETNLTKISALKFATYVVDLNETNPAISMVTNFENNITTYLSSTYDLATSLTCMKNKVIDIDHNSSKNWSDLNVSSCVNFKINLTVYLDPPLPPLSIIGISTTTLENNISSQKLQY